MKKNRLMHKLLFKIIKSKIYNCLPDKLAIKIRYCYTFLKMPNLRNPVSFNEKIQWLKLYDRKPIYTTMVDKVMAKDYVANLIGNEYIIPTLGVFDSFDDIDFDSLPSQFVIKCTHDSGSTIVCRDKDSFNIEYARKKICAALHDNYYLHGREWPYKNVKHRIIIEEYMDNKGEDLLDYKFFCFNGKPEYILLCQERFSDEGLALDFYSSNWEWMDFLRPPYHPHAQKKAKKPENFDKMMHLAEKLSQGIPFVRVDFYSVDNQVYFGEMTLYPGDGFEPFEPEIWDRKLGDLLVLPEKRI